MESEITADDGKMFSTNKQCEKNITKRIYVIITANPEPIITELFYKKS